MKIYENSIWKFMKIVYENLWKFKWKFLKTFTTQNFVTLSTNLEIENLHNFINKKLVVTIFVTTNTFCRNWIFHCCILKKNLALRAKKAGIWPQTFYTCLTVQLPYQRQCKQAGVCLNRQCHWHLWHKAEFLKKRNKRTTGWNQFDFLVPFISPFYFDFGHSTTNHEAVDNLPACFCAL